jgi:translocation and assembly module TamA
MRSLSAALAALSLAGCAALKPLMPGAAQSPAQSIDVAIEAPDDLKRLLDAHLDLVRLARLHASDSAAEPVSELELRRLQNTTPSEARALLATEGYMDAQVRVERAPRVTGERPRVRVLVEPGRRTGVAAVRLDVTGALADAAARGDAEAQAQLAAWREAWALPAGQPFTNGAWRDAKAGALTRLRSAGYAAATWSATAADVDADAATARLELRADSGPLYRTGALVIEGLARQDEKSARHLAGFNPGTPATETLLLDYQERLQRSGLFDRISVTLDPDVAQAAAATVTVRLTEAPLQQATVGFGISATAGPRVSLEHLHRRAFGERATLRNQVELGLKRSAWDGELSSHAMPGLYRNLVGGAIERIESDTDVVSSLRARAGRAYETQRIERTVFGQLERVTTRPRDTLAATRTELLAATLNFDGVWRDLDSIVLPTRGQSLALESGIGQVRSLDASNVTGQGSGAFGRLRARAQWWRPLGGQWYAQARLELGQVFARNRVDVPETQRFRAGGDDSVRGYAWRSLTPKVAGVDVGGRVLATASAEIARPVSEKLPSVWWAAFVDAGRAAESWNGFSPAWGAGVGVRWRSPVGPLRADVAYGEETRAWRLHLSVGIAF